MNIVITKAKPKVLWALRLLAVLSLLLVSQVILPHNASAAVTASDDFNRADGGLGANWTAISDGALAIASQQVVGTVGKTTGDAWSASTFTSDQYSQVQVTSTPLSGGQWIGAAVRMQGSGQTGYVGIYNWNSGSPVLEIFKRSGGGWAQLSGAYSSGALAAGTQLQLTAVGSTISFWQNGVKRLSVTDSSITGGAPGMMAYGNSTGDSWSGGNAASFTVGGTVSGLSGTVVLQDNAGDNLSVAANGPFTFATALVGGAAYSVTVKTNPAGQTCTVSNGSGTVGSANVTSVSVSCAGAASFTVGGTVSGLSGTVVLQDNGGDNLSVAANGPFTFATALVGGAAYSVTVKTNPAGQTCTVSNGSGTVGSANITSVAVSCANAASFTVGGTVSGLSGTVVLQDNGGNNLSVAANGTFTFATALAGGAAYSVTVLTNPTGQSCTVSNGSGTVGSANVTNVAVSCTTNTGTSAADNFNRADGGLGANWTAISDGGMAIASQQVVGTAGKTTGDLWTANTFTSDQYSQVQVTSTPLSGANWIGAAVRVQNGGLSAYVGIYKWNSGSPVLEIFKRSGGGWAQLSGAYSSGALAAGTQLQLTAVGSTISFWQNGVKRLSVTDSSITGGAPGMMASGNSTGDSWSGGNAASFTVGGTVSGLSGTVVLQDNAGDNLSLSANGTFTFATALPTGAAYSVTVKTNPAGQSCTVSNGSGTVGSANITSVSVSCASAASYTVGGTVSGLSGTVVLQDNAGDNLSVAANGPFTFATALVGGAAYSVTVKTNPAGQACTVSNGSGTVGSANITSVAVSCANAASYTVGGTVSGLSGTVVLQDNSADDLSLSANGTFTFATALPGGAAYSVTVKTNPSGQSCTVSNGSGTVGSANVTSVAVSCAASATSASDDFNRADGGLGANWTAISDGALAIASQQVVGTVGKTTGDAWSASTFTSDQYSQVQVTSTPLSGGQWIGAAVRMQGSGQTGYVGIYNWNSGSPVLEIFKRSGGGWAQLSGAYSSGALAAGTQLQLTAVGSTISFWQNGVKRLSVTDSSITGGAPGMMAYGNSTGDSWSGGNAASFTVGGTVSGLSGTVVLQDNAGDNLSVAANGPFTFATALPTGAPYNATVLTNPAGQTCTVSNGSGTVGSANITSVAVSCSNAASFTVGGTVSGLSGTVLLQDNGGDNLSVGANGTFTFATSLVGGASYSVTVKTNPTGQACTVSNGSGTVGSANITSVAVSCANAASYTVGGTVSGLSGTVVLQDNSADDLSLSANGTFTFATALPGGAAYSVTVKTNPSGQSCTVSNGSGTVGSANVTSVAVSCAASATSASDDFNRADGGLGANWTAISDGALAIASQQVVGTVGKTTGDAWSASTFTSDQYSQVQVTSTPLSGGQWIGAAVRMQGSGQTGYVGIYNWNSGSPVLEIFKRSGGGWAQLSGAYSSGALAAGTQLQLTAVGSTISFWQNGVKRLSVTDSSITGGAPGMMAYGNSTGDSWSGGNAASFTVGGTVSGLSGTVVLQDNAGDNLSVAANGPFTFATALPTGAPYNATVLTNPAGQTCTVSNGSGTVGSANITSVAVSCSNAASFTVGGTVSGLSGTVLLQDNGGDNLSVGANGTFTFATSLVGGASYSVTVKTNPTGQACTVSNGSGTVGSANITSVAVSCANAASYTVGGTVSGLSGTVVLQDNSADDLSLSANGTFTFATALPGGAAYSVTVKTNPSGQSCTVSNGSGTVGSANVTSVAVACGTNTGTSTSDDFNRADGGLGPNWTATSDGGMAIAGQQVTGNAAVVTGDMWTANSLGGDQYSEVQVTSTPLTGIQWVGPAVRMQNGGQNGYVGVYSWNSGSPVLELFERSGGGWTQVGAYNSGPLAAGTKLRLVAVGNSISFMVNGVERIGFTDSSFSSGAPGIVAFDSATADNWSGGTAGFQVSFQSTDAQGVKSYDVLSDNDGYGSQTLRVLAPTNPAAGVAHNFLIVLPVQSGLQTTFGDGLATLQGIDAQDQYNLTIIEPTFAIDPWYADNPNDPRLQYETFVTQELVPWIKQNLATTGQEQTWLLGFSKSGIGGQDLILKHPDLFTLAASWDLPADMSSYDQFGADSAQQYGTDANFQANYRLTTAFVDAHKAPFLSNNRIWIGGYNLYQPDDSDYDALLTSEGIVHSVKMQAYPAHSWDSGWIPAAMAALYQDSINLH